MKKRIMMALALGALLSSTAVYADHQAGGMPNVICPFKVSENADELKLNEKQREQVQDVKEQAMAAMAKVDGEMRAILSKGQIKKYEKMVAEKCADHKNCDGGSTCPTKKAE